MSLFKKTGKILGSAAKLTGQLGAQAVKLSGDALHGTTQIVKAHEHEIGAVAKAAVALSGRALQASGQALAAGAGSVAARAHQAGAQSGGALGKVAGHVAGYTADAVGVVGRAAGSIGSSAQKAAPTVGSATASAMSGVVGTVSGAVDTVALTERDFEKLRRRLQHASTEVRARSQRRLAAIELAQHERRKKDLLDLLVVGGVSLAALVRDPAAVPPEVARAFELAYPGLAASGETFTDAVQRMSADEVVGLVHGVKGKLFEMELVSHLNDGNLPDGVQAQLAGSATQPGHDIEIVDASGQVVELLQAKATESVAYVQEALQRYPDIDVTTTTEVHAQLVALGAADRVADSGISEAVLQQQVEAAVNAGHIGHMGQAGQVVGVSALVPSAVGLAVVALSSFMDKSLTMEQRGAEFGGRAAKLGVTGAAAKTVLVATHTWWLGLAVGVGSNWLATYGGNKRQRYEALRRVVVELERRVAVRAPIIDRPSALARN